MSTYVGPTKVDCPMHCDVPEGVEMTETPPPRHNWGDMLHCPNEGCERHFLVTKDPRKPDAEQ